MPKQAGRKIQRRELLQRIEVGLMCILWLVYDIQCVAEQQDRRDGGSPLHDFESLLGHQ